MDFDKDLDELRVKLASAQAAVKAAATETHAQIRERVDEASVAMDKEAKAAKAEAAQASDQAKAGWAQVKADAAAKVAKAKHDIDRRGDEFDADMAES